MKDTPREPESGRGSKSRLSFVVPELGLALPPWEAVNGAFCKAVFAEFVHMTAFLTITIGAITSSCHDADIGTSDEQGAIASGMPFSDPTGCRLTSPRVLTIAMAFGFAIAILVYSAATFSGAHLNPAVTLGLLVAKKLTLLRALCYWGAQIVGAILGSAFVYAWDRSGWYAANGGTNGVNPGTSNAGAWFMEFLLTSLLVFVVFAATDRNREAIGAHLPILAPLAIGFTVFICHLVAIPIDGCSINPARSFGPAVVSGIWDDQWVFWVGPMSGGVFAAVLYEVAFRPSRFPIMAPGGSDDDLGDYKVVQLPGYAGYKGAWQPAAQGHDPEELDAAEAGRHGATAAAAAAASANRPRGKDGTSSAGSPTSSQFE